MSKHARVDPAVSPAARPSDQLDKPERGRPPSISAAFLAVSIIGVGIGGLLWLTGSRAAADLAWQVTTLIGLGAAVAWIVGGLRRHRVGVDVIALLALVGTLAVGELFAGAIVSLMLATGRVLEERANRRARRELAALLARVPRQAHVHEHGTIVNHPVDVVVPGDLLLIEPGEVVPVDGRVDGGTAVLDEAALTGEALPVTRPDGDAVRSGVVNAGSAFNLRATTSASASTYASIIRLVESARRRPGAVRSPGRSLRTLVRPRRVGGRGAGVAGFGRRDSCGRHARGGDSMSVDSGRAGRGRLRDVPVRPPRCDREGRRGARAPCRSRDPLVRQDRDDHQWTARARGDPDSARRTMGGERDPAAGRIARPGVAACAGFGDRPCGPRAWARARSAHRCTRAAWPRCSRTRRQSARSRSAALRGFRPTRVTPGCDPYAVGPSVTAPSPCS